MQPTDSKKIPPLTPKQKELIRKAEEADMDSKMQGAVAKQFPNQPKPKKKAKPEGFKKGGKVRGCGMAKRGTRPAKMR